MITEKEAREWIVQLDFDAGSVKEFIYQFIRRGHNLGYIESSPIDQAQSYFEKLKAKFHEADYMRANETRYNFDEIKKLKDLYEKACEEGK